MRWVQKNERCYLHRNNVNPWERYEIDILDLAMLSSRIRCRNYLIFGYLRSVVAPFVAYFNEIVGSICTGTTLSLRLLEREELLNWQYQVQRFAAKISWTKIRNPTRSSVLQGLPIITICSDGIWEFCWNTTIDKPIQWRLSCGFPHVFNLANWKYNN